uniref:Uncharacterized protein n=1 Tax=Heterorhabditis bacteriophora TaxID=37862 RepID=A0A1I7W696_HETBA
MVSYSASSRSLFNSPLLYYVHPFHSEANYLRIYLTGSYLP